MSATVKSFYELVSKAFEEEPALWTPGWWYLMINKSLEMLYEHETVSSTDISHYDNLKNSVHKVSKIWSTSSNRSLITSWESLWTRIGAILGLTFQTSLSSQTIENVMCYMNISLSAGKISLETCSDSALIATMSTLSIPALSAVTNANAGGVKNCPVEASNQDTSSDQDSEIGVQETFSVQSYISSSAKTGSVTRGLTEEVKDYRIIVSTKLL